MTCKKCNRYYDPDNVNMWWHVEKGYCINREGLYDGM